LILPLSVRQDVGQQRGHSLTRLQVSASISDLIVPRCDDARPASTDRLIGNWGGRIYVEGVRSFEMDRHRDQDVFVNLDSAKSH
ncbi:MAG: hypothetical protein K1X58_14600, partial [Flavobacteriales bacterium]|nr:hypothetical protein [Flavobacteriales bacterium]